MQSTRNEDQAPSSQFSTNPSSFPTPPPGTGAVLTESLPDDMKRTPGGKLLPGLGRVGVMTEAIETFRENVRKGRTPKDAGIGAMANFVAEKLVEGVGSGLILTGAAVASTAAAPIAAPALAITTGVLLLAKSKEAGDLANHAAPILVNTTLDKLEGLKSSLLQFVKTAREKFAADSALSGATYPNAETAMIKLDYLQHLKDQGIYARFDEQQRLLYNWVARETFADYFQLDNQGKLKPTKLTVETRELKSNGDGVFRELGDIYKSLGEVQKKYRLSPETLLGVGTISDKEIGELFLSYGSTPEEIKSLYTNPDHVKIARSAVAQIKEQQKQIAFTIEAEQSLEVIHGTQQFFATLSQVGMFARSEALMTVGQVGFNMMQIAGSVVQLSAMPLGMSMMGPMGTLIGAGLSIISTVLGLGDDDSAQRQAEQLHAALYAISRQIEGLHERFDHIESMVRGMGGMINQVAYNQKILSDQLRENYKLVMTGFHVVSTVLQDMRAENRSNHDRIDSQLKYLIGKKEQDDLSDFQEQAKRRIKYVSSMALTESESDAAIARKEFKDLQSDIREACSPRRNGKTEFSAQDSDVVSRDLSLALNFLRRRYKENKDDGLGFIAEEVEQITKVPLITTGIKKELLPATSIWSHLVFNYIQLAQYPQYASVHDHKFANEIQEQANNLMKFIQYLKMNNIIELLLKKHQQSIAELQEMMFESFDLHKQRLLEDKKSDSTTTEPKKPKMLRVGDYFSVGEDKVFDKMRYKIDHEYYILQRLAAITGVSPELQKQLAEQDSAMDLLRQSFDFTEKPAAQIGGYYGDSLVVSTSTTPWSHKFPYMHESLEKFGGMLYGEPGKEKMIFVGAGGYTSDQTGGYASFGMYEFDLATGKQASITGGDTNVTDPKNPFYSLKLPMVEYKGNWKQTANHAWASFDIANVNGQKRVVWFSGGSGYVSTLDMNGCHVFLMKNTGKYKNSDMEHLYLYQESNGRVFYTRWGFDFQYLDSIKWPSYFPFPQSETKDPRPLGNSNPYIVGDILKITSERGHTYKDYQWKTIPGKKPFHVPIDGRPNDFGDRGFYGATEPDMTCYTHLFSILNKDYSSTPYLLVNRVQWNKEKKEAYVRFEVCDIQNKWLNSAEIDSLFDRRVSLDGNKGWTLTGGDTALTPNQFFIKMLKRYSFSGTKEDVVYGLINPKGESTELQMRHCEVKPSDDIFTNLSKPEGVKDITKSLPIAISEVYQTSSENMFEGYNSTLVLVSSVQTKDGKNKLLFINIDNRSQHCETHEYELPIPGHPIADWQAMKTTVATIMGKPHMIVTLLDKDYHMMVFTYDPVAKKVTRLANGPKLEFIDPNSGSENVRIHINHSVDRYLNHRRKTFPGFYPVNTISIQSAKIGEMDGLLISYPKPVGPGSPNYNIQVQRYPLTPALKVKPIQDVMARLTSAEEKALTVPPKLVMTAEVTKNLLKKAAERKIEVKAETASENLLAPAIDTCKKIQKLMLSAMKEFKYSSSNQVMIEEENKTMIRLLTELEMLRVDGVKKLKELHESIIQLNGYLSFSNRYAKTVGKSVNQQIIQLTRKVDGIDNPVAKKPSVHVAHSLFMSRPEQQSTSGQSKTPGNALPNVADTKRKQIDIGLEYFAALVLGGEEAGILTAKRQSLGFLDKGLVEQLSQLEKEKTESKQDNIQESGSAVAKPQSMADQLREQGARWGLVAHDVARRGNCFFDAVLDQLRERYPALLVELEIKSQEDLRKRACNYLVTHWEECGAGFVIGDPNQFIKDMLKNGEWAEGVIIHALAKSLKCTLTIIRHNGETPTIINPDKTSERTLILGYEVGIHYQSMHGPIDSALQALIATQSDRDNYKMAGLRR